MLLLVLLLASPAALVACETGGGCQPLPAGFCGYVLNEACGQAGSAPTSVSCSANGDSLDAGPDAGNVDWYPIYLAAGPEGGAPWVTDRGEDFAIDVAPLWPTLPASDFDASTLGLSISYLTLPANGDTAGFDFASGIDSGIPNFTDIKLLFDGKKAPGCKFAPGTITCPSVSTTVKEIVFSFSYDGSQGFAGIAMSIGNTSASCEICGG